MTPAGLRVAGDPDADLEYAHREWARWRRRQRIAQIHWVDALYQAYLTALVGLVAALAISGAIGDEPLGRAGLARFDADGPAVAGLAVAAAVALGLRSGGRGGPLALEPAEVRHVLLAPVERSAALRPAAVRQLRFALFVAAVVGGLVGNLAAHRLPESAVAWGTSGAVFLMVTVGLAYGAALVTSGARAPGWVATGLALIVVGWAVGDGFDVVPMAPTTVVGRLALWPREFVWWSLAAVVVAVGLVTLGMARLGGISVESAERRSRLVGQLRFAATLQDIRTVIVLRRQLAVELPRARPWLALSPRGRDRFPVWTRGWRGVLRWPAGRIGRMVLLGAVAGLALRGMWSGTTPLLLLAGLALFVAALDATEPLAQEIDHPSRARSVPVPTGQLHLRHIGVVAGVAVLVSAVGAAVAVLVAPAAAAAEVAAAAVVPVALGMASAGVVSVVMGAPSFSPTDTMLPPEAAGVRMAARAAWPPLIAVAGVAPLLAARAGADAGASPAAVVLGAGFGPVLIFAFTCAWVRFRDQAKAAWQRQLEQTFRSSVSSPPSTGSAPSSGSGSTDG